MINQDTNITYPIGIDIGLGRLSEESDYGRHVDQMIRQVLFTSPGERVNRPEFGCGIRQMLFAPNSPTAAALAQITVRQALDKWLGTVIQVNEIETEAKQETLLIRIEYTLRSRAERRYLNVEVGP